MILYPKVQQEAQQEIDEVVGSDRMPEWEDRENLPYIRGIIEESFRCTTIILSLASIITYEYRDANYTHRCCTALCHERRRR